jgi:hypothetical protein
MKLAYELGKTEKEIEALPPDEFGRWVAFFQILDEQEKKARKKAGAGLGGNRIGHQPGRHQLRSRS